MLDATGKVDQCGTRRWGSEKNKHRRGQEKARLNNASFGYAAL